MFKPRIRKLFIAGIYLGWVASQDDIYRTGKTPELAYERLLKEYNYYHNL